MSKLFAPRFVVQLLTEDDRPIFAVAHLSQASFAICCASSKQVLKAFSPQDLDTHRIAPGTNNRTSILTLDFNPQGGAYPVRSETVRLSAPHGTASKMVALLEQLKVVSESQASPSASYNTGRRIESLTTEDCSPPGSPGLRPSSPQVIHTILVWVCRAVKAAQLDRFMHFSCCMAGLYFSEEIFSCRCDELLLFGMPAVSIRRLHLPTTTSRPSTDYPASKNVRFHPLQLPCH